MSSGISSTSSSVTITSHSSVCSLLTWKDPIATGKVFGGIIAALIFSKVNISKHLFHLGYLALLAAAGAEWSGRVLTGQGFVKKYAGTPRSKADCFRKSVLPAIGDAVESIETKFYSIVYAQNIEATLKAAGIAYILFKLTSWFQLYTLIFAAVVLSFSIPPLYLNNKKEIDAAVDQYSKIAKEKTAEFTTLAQDTVAPHMDAFVKKTGPVGAFLQSRLPTRTAGTTVGSHAYASHSRAKGTDVVEEPSVGITTGASKFPDVPSHASPETPQSITEAVEATTQPTI